MTKNRKLKLFACVIGALFFAGAVITLWPKGNPRGNESRGRYNSNSPQVVITPGQKTLEDVPLFELPWRPEVDVDARIAAAKNHDAVVVPKPAAPVAAPVVKPAPVPVATRPQTGPAFGDVIMAAKTKAPVADGPDFSQLMASTKPAPSPAANTLDISKLMAAANPKPIPAPVVPKNNVPAPAAPKNSDSALSAEKISALFEPPVLPANKNATALVPFGPNFKPLEAVNKAIPEIAKPQLNMLLINQMRQICGGRKPTFDDWKTLCDKKPAGLKKEDLPPIGEGRFIMSLCEDLDGRIWIGCEDEGIWCYDDSADLAEQWQRFTRKNTGGRDETDDSTTIEAGNFLGDDNGYALACDRLGRIWVGHLNHGVSVYNGKEWKNYNILEGPIGERVFAIATCPTDGDVWIATSAGLTRYSLSKNTWSHYTRAEGLPSDQASAIAFDNDGNIIVGSQCDGLVLADAKDDYQTWRRISCPNEYLDREPIVSKGEGLPTNFINGVSVAADGTIYVATSTGLAWSKNKGKDFEFIRGEEWNEKVQGLHVKPVENQDEVALGLVPSFFSASNSTLLSEDFLSSIVIDKEFLWAGTRRGKLDCIQQKNSKMACSHGRLDTASIRALLSSEKSGLFAGQYGKGLSLLRPAKSLRVNAAPTTQASIPPMPLTAAAPTSDELRSLVAEVSKVPVKPNFKESLVAPLPDDWMTRGQWLGRYGRYWMCLAATIAPRDFIWGTGAKNVGYSIDMGPHHKTDDSVRYWIHWNHTKHRGSLELPNPYLHSRVEKGLTKWDIDRRQSEWDDHSETYSSTYEGPDLYVTVNVPAGLFVMSLYDVNKDGQSGVQEVRDFRISIKSPAGENFFQSPELANGRIRDFWGGVYKRFLVRGPINLNVRLERRYSFATILAAVSLDLVEEDPYPYLKTQSEAAARISLLTARQDRINASTTLGEVASQASDLIGEDNSAARLFALLSDAQNFAPVWHGQESRRYYAALARFYRKNDARNSNLTLDTKSILPLSSCYYQLNIFSAWEANRTALGLATSRGIEKGLRWSGNPSTYADECLDLVRAYRVFQLKSMDDKNLK